MEVSITRECVGRPVSSGVQFEEQLLTVTGSFVIHTGAMQAEDGQVLAVAVAKNATAAVVKAAVLAAIGLTEDPRSVDVLTYDPPATNETAAWPQAVTTVVTADEDADTLPLSRQWVVRFYLDDQSPLLLLAADPTWSHLEAGDLPLLAVTGGLKEGGGAYSAVVVELRAGSVPLSYVPPLPPAPAMPEEALPEEAAEDVAIVVAAPVLHICGDGSRTSQEQCDDGNGGSGDGCRSAET